MKSYQVKYNLNQRTPAKLYVSKFSAYKIGIDAYKDGVRCESIKLYDGNSEISSEGTYYGYQQFDMTASQTPGARPLKVLADGAYLDLTVVTTDSDVSELPCTGSGGGEYTLPTATAIRLGGVKIGDNVGVADDGTISVAAPYELPIATETAIGGVKFNEEYGIKVDSDGNMALRNAGWSSASQLGGVQVLSGGGIHVDDYAVISVDKATTSSIGGVIVGDGLSVDADGKIGANAEEDPVFTTWKGNSYIVAGQDSSIALGRNTGTGVIFYPNDCVAIGLSAQIPIRAATAQLVTPSTHVVQLGTGSHSGVSSLYFLDWKMCNSSGCIPKERLLSANYQLSSFTASEITLADNMVNSLGSAVDTVNVPATINDTIVYIPQATSITWNFGSLSCLTDNADTFSFTAPALLMISKIGASQVFVTSKDLQTVTP